MFDAMQFEGSNIIVPYGKTQSCKVSSGLLHPVLSAFTQTVPLIATSGPESCTIVHELANAGDRGGGKAKDVGGIAASNYYRERGPRRMKEGRLHSTISVLHVCLRPWLHVALLPCNLTSSTLGASSLRPSSFTHTTSAHALSSRFRYRFSMAGIHHRPSSISSQLHYAIDFAVSSCFYAKKSPIFRSYGAYNNDIDTYLI